MKPIVPKPQRCAIYAPESTEHNLDLEFNSRAKSMMGPRRLSGILTHRIDLPRRPHQCRLEQNHGGQGADSDKASSFPELDVPGCFDSQRLPKAVAVVNALKNTARVRLDCKRFVVPARHAITK